MLVSLRCPTCTAPVTFAPGARVTTCTYCRSEVRDVDAPAKAPVAGGIVLGETIAIRAPSGRMVPLLESGAPLPAHTEQTLSTSRDDQPSIRCELMASDHSVGQLEVAVARAPRGVAKAPLVVRVDDRGNVHAAITTEDAMANASFTVLVRR